MAEHQKFEHSNGLHYGSGTTLTKNILEFSGLKSIDDHPWYTRKGALQAHHIIVTEAMKNDDDWKDYCRDFGYNINSALNGVLLPSYMKLACQLGVAMHRSNHGATTTEIRSDNNQLRALNVSEDELDDDDDDGEASTVTSSGLNYPDAVIDRLNGILTQLEDSNTLCEDGKLVTKLNALSKEILGHINNFTWTLTYDGKDYKSHGRGCGGPKIDGKMANKRNSSLVGCKCKLKEKRLTHGITKYKENKVIPKNTVALKVGK